MTKIAPLIESFFRDRLQSERGTSQNTQNTYAYAFQLLFEFAANQLKKSPSSIFLENIDASMITAFLEYLEMDRKNSPVTRNARLAAIKSFMHFVEYRVPSALEQVRRILAIPIKKTDSRLIPHLNKEEIDALIDALKSTTRSENRDRAMIYLCITSGLRVSELIGVQISDLSLQSDPSIRIHGKGRKERALPLWKETVDALQSWLAVRGEVKAPEIFVNNQGKAMTGHESMQSTEIYLRADPSENLETLNTIVPPALRKGRFRPPDHLMAILKPHMLCGANNKDSTVNSEVRGR